VRPEALETAPKQRIDEETVLLGDREIPVVRLIAAVLARVAQEAVRTAGGELLDTTLTCPAAWGSPRRERLLAAARLAGLERVRLAAEPVAAAIHFAGLVPVPTGASVLVYDFGAGTFDASVVRNTPTGPVVLAAGGLVDTGGLDIDAALVAQLGSVYGERDPDTWQRLVRPGTAEERRANRQLWEDVRRAKELLSRTPSTHVFIPLLGVDAPLGREQLDDLARPIVERTIGSAELVLRNAGVPAARLAGAFLVGGASRLPLAATLLHRALGVAPTAIEQPELAVAEGSLLAPAIPAPSAFTDPSFTDPSFTDPSLFPPGPIGAPPIIGPAAPSSRPGPSGADAAPAPEPADTVGPPPRPPRPRRRGWTWVGAGAAAAVAAGAIAVPVALHRAATNRANTAGTGPAAPGSKSTAPPACGRKIAFIGGLTGSAASFVVPIQQGTQLAVDQYNAAHPSCTVALLNQDTTSDPAQAPSVASRVVADPTVLGVIGPVLSGEVTAAGAILENATLPMISPSASSPELSTRHWTVFHRLIGDDGSEGTAAGKYLTQQLHASKVYVVGDGSTTGNLLTEAAKKVLGDARITGRGTVDPDGRVLAPLVAQITSKHADAVYDVTDAGAAGQLLNQLRKAGNTVNFVGTSLLLDNQTFTQNAGSNLGAVHLTCLCVPIGDSGTAAKFRADFQSRFKTEVGDYSGYGYDAARIFLGGIGTGVPARPAMLSYVNRYDSTGVMGRYRFTSTGNLEPTLTRVGVYRPGTGSDGGSTFESEESGG
jgi:ABC-type branched-subunit amino acid transport system substrate-binding protein